MNEWDRDNLNFIMSCSDKEFKAWFDQATEDDISYALELIKQSRCELLEQEFEVFNRESERCWNRSSRSLTESRSALC